MSRRIFTELDHRLSVVKRWSVVQTIRQQSTAEHSFNVVILSLRIAEKWFGASDDYTLLKVMKHATFHDFWESITGDPPTYMKRFIDESGAITEFEANGASEGVDLGPPDDFTRVVVKIADYIEALIFLRMEVSLGNRSVINHIREVERRFKDYLEDNPINTVSLQSVFGLYEVEIVDGMFGGNGQFISELHGFPKR